jgi:hypothetical protein
MNSQSLSHVTLQSLENYRAAATQAVAAYRFGSHRLVHAFNGALKNSVYPLTAKVAPAATDRMDEVRGNVSEIVVKGIDQVAQSAEKAIELGSNAAVAQVTKVVDFAAGVDNQVVAGGLQAAARASLPGAKLALVVSSRVADGAHALAGVAGARPLQTKATKAVKKAASVTQRKAAPLVRKAKASVNTTVKAASQRVTKAGKAVQAPVAQVKRSVRSAKKAVGTAVSA